ncbi:MAG: biotin-dependent carboxyltransferase family protein [Candidatus Nanopelagicales bacterium]
MTHSLHVVDPGLLTLVQDAGRAGLSRWGVGPSGAADRESYHRANDLVGNAADAAVLEHLGGGLRLRAVGDVWVAVAGAVCDVDVDGVAAVHDARIRLRDGAELRVGPPQRGLRSYVAVRGGIDVVPVLGSRSRDVLAGLGPEPLRRDDVLPVGPVEDAPWSPRSHRRRTWREGVVELEVLVGPRHDRVPGYDALLDGEWETTAASSRVALRLARPEGSHASGLAWDAAREWPSEGLVRGAVQVPPSGLPVLFLADHPVTGGYPVVAVVLDADTDVAGQVRPGQRIRFVGVSG